MILIVDDEERYIRGYIQVIREAGLRFEHFERVDEALSFLVTHRNEIKVLILDIMMAPGKSFELVDTDSGMRTGLKVYEQVRQIAQYLPVMILTNVTDPKVAQRFKDEEHCWFGNKRSYTPDAFLSEVRIVMTSCPTIG